MGRRGPNTFDCSGLTSQAWAAAGQGIPRTSQEQWKQLDRIAVEAMRPGDLIIYNSDASHVALYIGDGAIIHAPPGAHGDDRGGGIDADTRGRTPGAVTPPVRQSADGAAGPHVTSPVRT